jgi:hypothetical protein
MSEDIAKAVESLIRRAEESEQPDYAVKFSQAACNAAKAIEIMFVCSRKTEDNTG